jgi:hypothetical protein
LQPYIRVYKSQGSYLPGDCADGTPAAVPKTKQVVRDHLKANGATDLYINDYVKKIKAAGKI